jgi:hypothetical protein
VPLLVVEVEMDDEATLVVGVELEEPETYVGPVEMDDAAKKVGSVEREILRPIERHFEIADVRSDYDEGVR